MTSLLVTPEMIARAKEALPPHLRAMWEAASIPYRRLILRRLYEHLDRLVERGEA